MQDLLAHPAFQSAVAPLISGLLVAWLLKRFGRLWQGLAVVTGLLVSVWLTVGLNFQPLTSTRKIILSSLLVPFLAFPLARFSCSRTCLAGSLALVSAFIALWVVWPVLVRQEGMALWQTGSKIVLFSALVTGCISWFGRTDLAKQGGTLLALGFGTGTATFIGSSALYGQLSFAVTAALGGLVLVLLFTSARKEDTAGIGSFTVFAASIPLALIGGAATVFAKLPGMALLFLLLVPVFSAIPLARKFNIQNLWLQGILVMIQGLLPAIPAIWLAMSASEPLGY